MPEAAKAFKMDDNLKAASEAKNDVIILREPSILTGQHCNRASPFAACDERVPPRNQAKKKPKSSEHLHRARPFAAAGEEPEED